MRWTFINQLTIHSTILMAIIYTWLVTAFVPYQEYLEAYSDHFFRSILMLTDIFTNL